MSLYGRKIWSIKQYKRDLANILELRADLLCRSVVPPEVIAKCKKRRARLAELQIDREYHDLFEEETPP